MNWKKKYLIGSFFIILCLATVYQSSPGNFPSLGKTIRMLGMPDSEFLRYFPDPSSPDANQSFPNKSTMQDDAIFTTPIDVIRTTVDSIAMTTEVESIAMTTQVEAIPMKTTEKSIAMTKTAGSILVSKTVEKISAITKQNRFAVTTIKTSVIHHSMDNATATPPFEIGCFGEEREFRFIPDKIKTVVGIRIVTKNLSECKQKCQESFIYFYFNLKTSNCVCSDRFRAMVSYDAKNCIPEGSGSIVGYRGNTTGLIVEKFLRSSSRMCRCSTPSCQSITCDYISEGPGCWIGPRKADIKNYLRHKESEACGSGEYTIKVMRLVKSLRNANTVPCDRPECVYCVKPVDMYGFWPISDCATFHPKRLDNSSQRIYEVIPPKNMGNSSTVYTSNRRNQTKLLLVGYYRSGSTFTSELFRNHNDAFYLFEPLFSVFPVQISYQHEEIHEYLTNQTTKTLNSLFNCDMLAVSLTTFSKFSQTDLMHQLCSTNIMVDCVALFTSRCQSKKITVIKSIRARMQSAQALLKSSLPELKIVLLLRDPRGIMNSRLTNKGGPDHYSNDSKRLFESANMLCKAMASDAKIARELKKEYPNQVVLVHYEDIAKYSDTAADHIYRELGMKEPPPEVLQAIQGLQSKGKETIFGVKRKDSVATAYKWKKSMAYTKVKVIDEACKESYAQLGYRAVNSDQELSDPDNYHREFIALI